MQNNNHGVRISNVTLKTLETYNELSANVDGDQIWIRVPKDFPLRQRGEIFVAAGLLEAMIRNEPLILDENTTISSKLFNNLTELQNIYSSWNTDLNVVPIYANTEISADESENTASYFSGGIDSSQTLITHFDEITYLIYIRGFGEFLHNDEWNACVSKNKIFAENLNKALLPIDSNLWPFFQKRKISVYFFHGLILCGLAGTLGFKKTYIPSSHTYSELFPWGSHPLTDPLWSTEQSTIIHDGAQFRRTQKTEIVASVPEVLENLQVCWMSNTQNCGVCSKCVRTRLALDLLGFKTNAIPTINSIKQLKEVYPDDENSLTMVQDVMLLTKSKGVNKYYKALRKGVRKYKIKVALANFDRIFLNGILRKLKHLKPAPWQEMRVLLTSKKNDLFEEK